MKGGNPFFSMLDYDEVSQSCASNEGTTVFLNGFIIVVKVEERYKIDAAYHESTADHTETV